MPGILKSILFTALCSLACFHFGPTADKLPLTQGPNGATVTVQTTSQSVTGELLAVRDDGVVILRGSKLAFAPFADLRSVKVAVLSEYSIGAGAPSPDRRARLNAVSRYPQGIGAELQRKLFAQSGQTALAVLR